MRRKIKKIRKICIASGIIFAQASTLGALSTPVYAITDNQVSDFMIKANQDQIKTGENITLAIKGGHNQGEEIEVAIPDSLKFNEKETAKLNEKNGAIESIRMKDQSVLRIKRSPESSKIGELFLVLTGEKAGQYTITAKMKRENKEIETKTSVLTIFENVKENTKQAAQKSEGNESEKAKEPLQPEKQEEKAAITEVKEEAAKGKQKSSTMPLHEAQYAVTNGGSVTKSSYFKDANTAIIPADNAFMIRRTPETKMIASSGYIENGYLLVDAENPTGSITLANVGYYKNKKVTLKISMTNKSKSWSAVSFSDKDGYFLGVDVGARGEKGVVDIEYSFFDDEGNPLPIKTSLNYKGLNRAKTVSIFDFENKIENMYALEDTSIQYDILGSGTYTFRSEEGGYHDNQQKITFTTKEITNLKLQIANRESTTSSLEYLRQFLPNVDIPGIEAKNQSFQVANDPNIGSNFIQTIPYLNSGRYMNQLSYVVNADIGNQYAKSKWIVTNLQGEDWTNGFTFQKNPDGTTTITAKPETLKKSAFYDNVYLLKELYDFVGSESNLVDKGRLTPTNQYPIHFQASQSVNGDGNHAKTSGTTLINYLSQVQVQHIDQETKQPLPNVQDTVVEGIITDPFHVNPITIPGYQVVKNQPITGIFLPEKQMLSHLYTPVKATLEANDFSTVIGNIPTDQEEIKKFILKEAKVKATELPNNTDITNQVKVKDTGDLHNEIGSYVVTLEVMNVEKEITVKVMEGNLELLSVPEKISFEAIKIPSKERVFNRNGDQGEIIVADKRENRSEWNLYVKQVKPLSSNENDVLSNALVYTQNGVDMVLNNQNYLIQSQISPDYKDVHLKWKDTEGIRLKIQPGPNVKANTRYQGELEWTLTDTPV